MTRHDTVSLPTGTVPARFRPPIGASDAASVSLEGSWRFRLFPSAETGADPADRGDGWDTIEVPGHW
jgi:beta-galactosidase